MKLPQNVKKVFVTGGAGFIGSHVVDYLINLNISVTVYDNLSSGKKEFLKKHLGRKNFKLITGDLLNISQLRNSLDPKTDLVFHLAANPDISKGIDDPTLDFNQTIVATFNVLQVLKEKKIKRLIYLSGSGVYGNTGKIFTGESYGPLLPVSVYGASKLSAEGLISAFSNLYGIKVWIFRPANIIGGRATHGVIFDFINKLKINPRRLLILGDGRQSKSYLYIDDVIKAVFLTLQKGAEKTINVFNISSDSYITVNDIAKIIIAKTGLKNVKITHTLGKIGWPGDVPLVRIDTAKLKSLGWKSAYSSRQAVEKTVEVLLKSS